MKLLKIRDISIPYDIKKSLRNTCTRYKIKNKTLFISCPIFYSEAMCINYIFDNEEKYYKWIKKNLEISKVLNDGDYIKILGKLYTVKFDDIVYIDNNVIYIRQSHKNYDLLVLFKERFTNYLKELTIKCYDEMFNDSNYPSISFKQVKTYFGECYTKKRNITYNYYLLFNSIELYEYVVKHELAHLKYPNHSAEFHNYLELYCKNHRKLRSQLRKEGLRIW